MVFPFPELVTVCQRGDPAVSQLAWYAGRPLSVLGPEPSRSYPKKCLGSATVWRNRPRRSGSAAPAAVNCIPLANATPYSAVTVASSEGTSWIRPQRGSLPGSGS